MANNTTMNPMRIDTFGADVTISTGSVKVLAILATAYSSAKTVTFIDNEGEEVLRVEVASDSTGQFTPAEAFLFSRGLIFDDSGSDLAAGDFVYIYLK
jgi:hypothetical protein